MTPGKFCDVGWHRYQGGEKERTCKSAHSWRAGQGADTRGGPRELVEGHPPTLGAPEGPGAPRQPSRRPRADGTGQGRLREAARRRHTGPLSDASVPGGAERPCGPGPRARYSPTVASVSKSCRR